jgi:hypothetical protein
MNTIVTVLSGAEVVRGAYDALVDRLGAHKIDVKRERIWVLIIRSFEDSGYIIYSTLHVVRVRENLWVIGLGERDSTSLTREYAMGILAIKLASLNRGTDEGVIREVKTRLEEFGRQQYFKHTMIVLRAGGAIVGVDGSFQNLTDDLLMSEVESWTESLPEVSDSYVQFSGHPIYTQRATYRSDSVGKLSAIIEQILLEA